MMSAPKRDALQAEAHPFHTEEDDGENEGNGDRDDESGPKAKAQEAHREHDGDCLEEGLSEAANRLANDLGLV